MKKILIIASLFLFSCKDFSPSACDCAELEKERSDARVELLTKTIEEKEEIESNWHERFSPCEEIKNESQEFKQEIHNCLMVLFESENEKTEEENQE